MMMIPIEGQSIRQEQLCIWRLAGVAATRADWDATNFNREHVLATPGVYVYWGRPPGDSLLSVYVGQSGAIIYRLGGHRKKRAWLRYAMAVYSKESPLHQSLLRFLEVKLIHGVCRIANTENLRCKTRKDNLPISDERFLGREHAIPAISILTECCELLSRLPPQVDVKDGALVAACFKG